MSTRCLSVHAGYACRHAAACCGEAWTVAAEPHVVELVRRGVVRPVREGPAFVRTSEPELAGSRKALAHSGGWCVFFEGDPGRLCGIHRQAGEQALPSACRHFPRLYLHDDRGSSVSLSHFCPTAASLLFEPVPLRIVEARPPLALAGETEGFEARGALPPLLRPDMLMDLHAYDAWERRGIETFARDDLTHVEALDFIGAGTEALRRREPAVAQPFRAAVKPPGRPEGLHYERHGFLREDERLELVAQAAFGPPAAYDAARLAEDRWREAAAQFDRAIKNFLAARLFATRLAYEARGLRSIVEWLRVCLAVLRDEAARLSAGNVVTRDIFMEAIRATDLTLVHRTDSLALARSLQRIEAA